MNEMVSARAFRTLLAAVAIAGSAACSGNSAPGTAAGADAGGSKVEAGSDASASDAHGVDAEADATGPQGDASMSDHAAEGAAPSDGGGITADAVAGDGGEGWGASEPFVCGACAAGYKSCAQSCVQISDPAYGCGSGCMPCALPHADARCAGAACAIKACEPGFQDCDGDPSNGCEADLEQPSHCGACGTACAPGQVCTASGCAPQCNPPLTSCNGACVDLTTSAKNCGGCGSDCHKIPESTAACSAGTCSTPTCASGYTLCNGSCVDLTSDSFNCGACNASCPTGCANSVCSCPPGFTYCPKQAGGSATCVALATDQYACGTCTTNCVPPGLSPQAVLCRAGQCGADDSTLVVSGLSSTPVEIAVDATHVYWIGSDQTVGTSDKTGAGVATFAQSPYAPQHITIDASYVYWSNNLGGAVVRLSKQAGAPATFAAATEPTSIAIASDGTVYWVEQGTTIRFAAEGGGAPMVLATSSNDIGDIAVDDSYVYAATATPSSAQDSARRSSASHVRAALSQSS
jgi:hypothetical protein